jgi:hypothetical protein
MKKRFFFSFLINALAKFEAADRTLSVKNKQVDLE